MAGMLTFFTRAGNGTGMTEGGSRKDPKNPIKIQTSWKRESGLSNIRQIVSRRRLCNVNNY